MPEFLYLVQGQADLVERFRSLGEAGHRDVILLTYDRPIDGAEHYPESTWAEGRNRLLEIAQARSLAEVLVFCDDDTSFVTGDWDAFEAGVRRERAAVTVPVVPRTRATVLPRLRSQSFLLNDQQVVAVRRELVDQALLVPWVTRFDDVDWWASCELEQLVIQNHYRHGAVQLNDVEVINEIHHRYPATHEGRRDYPALIREWFAPRVRGRLVDFRRPSRRYVPITLWRTASFRLRRHLRGRRAWRPRRVR